MPGASTLPAFLLQVTLHAALCTLGIPLPPAAASLSWYCPSRHTPENPISVHRQGTLCLAPTCSSLNGPFILSGLCNVRRLPSLSHPAYLALPVGSELPLGWGSSYTTSPHDSSLSTQTALPRQQVPCRVQDTPWPLSAGHLLGAKPSFLFIPEEWQLRRPLCFCTDHTCHLQGSLGHRRRRTLPTFLSVSFSPRTSGSALWSPALGAGPVTAVNVPPASEGPPLGLTTNLTLSCHGHSWLTLSQQA